MTVGSRVKNTLVTLRSIESTLRIYSLQEQNKKAKAAYKKALEEVDGVTQNLDKRLKFLEYEEPQYKGN
ncbi:DUF1657 domain-containing protein [Clostridium kluyveri]|uniref:DUF1657 domain-containing protein n=1 Tax=Clostridium kluyveri (strain ATCC 8527 / DSM 555 / NBRC 12016 / NCIMB 10680 / K1) TaxID=431943 RepID=A5N8K5_CLOK5|nr:DUF1657 domain-containing protein [Clostridium kluyveri]EDK33636.1 Conserved hypothetical protein [Clostridium kluyveri DSM 555]